MDGRAKIDSAYLLGFLVYGCVHRAEHIGELVWRSENAPNLRTFDEGMRAKNTSPSDV
jgi:hypothetical protein